MARNRRSTRRSRHARTGIFESLLEGATDIVGTVAKEVAPEVVGVLDVDGVIQEIDIQAVLDRIDLNALLDRIDIDLLLDRMDVNALIDRLDVDQIVAKLDVNAVLEQVDVDALVERTQIGALIARCGRGCRRRGAGCRAQPRRRPRRLCPSVDEPILTEGSSGNSTRSTAARGSRQAAGDMTAHIAHVAPERDLGLQGCYAGVATRMAAFAIDVITALTLFALASSVVEYVVSALVGSDVRLRDAPIIAGILLAAWWVFYSAYPLAQAGRTLGMVVVGLRVVRGDGSDLDARHAIVRVLVFPLSFLFLGLGFVLILFRRDRRALHDLLAGTAVVYAWDARAARLRFLAKRGTE